jgi:hypothetical protein
MVKAFQASLKQKPQKKVASDLFNSDYNLDASVDSVDSAIWELNNGKYQELD